MELQDYPFDMTLPLNDNIYISEFREYSIIEMCRWSATIQRHERRAFFAG